MQTIWRAARGACVPLVLALGLAGCGNYTAADAPPGPFAFRSGWADGCNAARAEFNYGQGTRNWDAYRQIADYRTGWDEGHQTCAARLNAIWQKM
jgi:hypothetical protein